jgi:hypothetical protein
MSANELHLLCFSRLQARLPAEQLGEEGLECAGFRLFFYFYPPPPSYSFCSFLLEKKIKFLMELYKVYLPITKLQKVPHPVPLPAEDSVLVCISFVTCHPDVGGFLSAARAGVRPREEAPTRAFGQDSSLPRGSGEVLATVR